MKEKMKSEIGVVIRLEAPFSATAWKWVVNGSLS